MPTSVHVSAAPLVLPANWRHSTVEYLRAALASGFKVRDVEEPTRPSDTVDVGEQPTLVEHPDLPPDIWALHPWAAEAANAAKRNDPALIIWDFELEASS